MISNFLLHKVGDYLRIKYLIVSNSTLMDINDNIIYLLSEIMLPDVEPNDIAKLHACRLIFLIQPKKSEPLQRQVRGAQGPTHVKMNLLYK